VAQIGFVHRAVHALGHQLVDNLRRYGVIHLQFSLGDSVLMTGSERWHHRRCAVQFLDRQNGVWETQNGEWAASVSPDSHPAGTEDVDKWEIANGRWTGALI
jgi:hypothetical protein